MPAPKFKQYFNEMFQAHQEKMMKFMILNQDYKTNKVKHANQFHTEGKEVQEIVNNWLNRLCHQMEKGQNSAYSAKLADKFLGEVTKYFPYYHEVGVIVKK